MSFIHHIFLSYSRLDTAMMQKVRDDLRDAGFIVWTDEGLEVGTPSWERDIENAIRNTGCLVVLLSPDANQSKWVRREFTFADIHEKRIFPMLLRGDESNAIPLRLAQHNYLDIRQNYDDGMARMIRDIRRHLNMPETTSAPPVQTPSPKHEAMSPKQPAPNVDKIPPKDEVLQLKRDQAQVYPPPKPIKKSLKNDFIPRTNTSNTKRGFLFVAIGGIVGVVVLVLLLASGALSGNNSAKNILPTGTARPANEVIKNEDWTPIEQDFDGVVMVLVPAGCFMMGSDDEQPVHEQCFETPFWIDKYEVTQAQFMQFGGEKANTNNLTGDNLPVKDITWFEARDYCELRGGRLPTEREWEYVARGPNNLIYPWGNDFVADNVVYGANANETAPVGSRVGGVSWVGAMDMSGNVWEWVSSLYGAYPYDETDEDISDNTNYRVMRGGAWYVSDDSVRASDRNGRRPVDGLDQIGVRCSRFYSP